MASDNQGIPSGVTRATPGDQGDRGREPANDELDLGIEADDEAARQQRSNRRHHGRT